MPSLQEMMTRHRGPVFGRGPGKPWSGIVEDTACVWVTWFVEVCKREKRDPGQFCMYVNGVPVVLTWVQLTFGRRWYWTCPMCKRRCEAIYTNRAGVGCRVCLHLGYRSQTHRPSSVWGMIDRIYSRTRWLPPRLVPEDAAQRWATRELREFLMGELQALVAQVRFEPSEDVE